MRNTPWYLLKIRKNGKLVTVASGDSCMRDALKHIIDMCCNHYFEVECRVYLGRNWILTYHPGKVA